MSSKLAIVLPITCIAMLATCQVWLSHLRYETSLETAKIQKAQSEQKHEIHKLELELASLTRPERLRKIAQSELGMAPPRPMQVLRP